jgi:hypothetical protein
MKAVAVLLVTLLPLPMWAIAADSWTDDSTGLMWAVKDNGSDLDWKGARNYCTSLRTGGYSNWRLPTIEELQQIYVSSSTNEYKIKGPIRLSSCCMWSSTLNGSGKAWSFGFVAGWRFSATLDLRRDERALCVRGVEK